MISEEAIYHFCRKTGVPYFGQHIHATQGDSRRHIYMQALVESQAKVRAGDPLRILEVGSWAGGSAITWGTALKTFNRGNGSLICVDPWRPYFDAEKISALGGTAPVYKIMADAAASGEIYELFLHNIRSAGLDDVVMPFRGESDRILPLLARESFDIVFVDGAHTYNEVKRDLNNCAQLTAEGGVLCGDDLEMQLAAVDDQFNRENLERDYVQDPKSKNSYHPGVTRAIGEFFKCDVSTWEGFWAMRKQGQRWEPVELSSASRFSVPAHLAGSTAHVTLMMINYAREKGLIS